MVRNDTRNYDLFKSIVTLVLIVIIAILLMRACASAARVVPTMLAPPQVDGEGQVSFSGLGQAGATIQVVANGAVIGTTSVGADGRWSLVAQLGPGDYQVSARALGATGKLANQSGDLALNVPQPKMAMAQAAAPAPATATPLPASATLQPTATSVSPTATPVPPKATPVPPTATLAAPTATPRTTPVAPTLDQPVVDPDGVVTLSGSGLPGTKIEALANGAVVGSATVDSAGRWATTYKAQPGAVALTVQQQGDPQSRSGAMTITVPPPQSQGEFYTVQEGDWLSKLAAKYYGDPAEYTRIVQATNELAAKDSSLAVITNPDLILPGQKLWIPAAP